MRKRIKTTSNGKTYERITKSKDQQKELLEDSKKTIKNSASN